jgi:hypothetical protein
VLWADGFLYSLKLKSKTILLQYKKTFAYNVQQLGEVASEALALCVCLAILPNCLLAAGLLLVRIIRIILVSTRF